MKNQDNRNSWQGVKDGLIEQFVEHLLEYYLPFIGSCMLIGLGWCVIQVVKFGFKFFLPF